MLKDQVANSALGTLKIKSSCPQRACSNEGDGCYQQQYQREGIKEEARVPVGAQNRVFCSACSKKGAWGVLKD